MGTLVAALLHDIKVIDERIALGIEQERKALQGNRYAFVCSLGRCILMGEGEDPTNTDKAIRIAESFISSN